MSTSEVRILSELIAGFVCDRVINYPSDERQGYIENQWPYFEPLAKDIIIFLLGDEYDLEGDAPRTKPQVVEGELDA